MEQRAGACPIGAGLSTGGSAWGAAAEAAREGRRNGLEPGDVDLAFVFLSAEHLDEVGAAAAAVREDLAPRHLLGCVADGVIARGREVEDGPAVAVWAAALPGAEVE